VRCHFPVSPRSAVAELRVSPDQPWYSSLSVITVEAWNTHQRRFVIVARRFNWFLLLWRGARAPFLYWCDARDRCMPLLFKPQEIDDRPERLLRACGVPKICSSEPDRSRRLQTRSRASFVFQCRVLDDWRYVIGLDFQLTQNGRNSILICTASESRHAIAMSSWFRYI